LSTTARRRSWWGWGYEDAALPDHEVDDLGQWLATQFPGAQLSRTDPPSPDSLDLPQPRLAPPDSLAPIVSTEVADRARHASGCSFRDVVRALAGRVEHPPDLVVRPRDDREVSAVLEWCADVEAAVVPFGGGTSVVGGVEPDVGPHFRGAVSLDLQHLDGVLEVDELSQAARIQAGALGPTLEEQLGAHGLTLRHFPQSFECSTLGGWIATRAGGHFATGPTHIDDLVEAIRLVAPAGVLETRRLPGSGAGPSPDRLLLGSEGALGVVTEAWVRVRPRPTWRAGGAAHFVSFSDGVAAVRALSQSGLQPANCRLLDATEAIVNGVSDAVTLIVGFESADHPLDAWATRAVEVVRDHRGAPVGEWTGEASRAGASSSWRGSFLRAPYLRDALVRLGMVTETFETAVTWDRYDSLAGAVEAAVRAAMVDAGMEGGLLTCRFTHVYPDGPAPYFTVIAPAHRGGELDQWAQVKAAASEAILDHGGTITHHHAVGRDHRSWYDRQRPRLFGKALARVKATLDPAGICNPGVLMDPLPRPRV